VARARDIAREATERARELGSYRLVERLGVGGMGEVWRAEHRLLVRNAAIKLIRPETLAAAEVSPAELRERFRREAQTLASLRSRHTIDLFDYGVSDDGTFFFVMELLEGMDLDTLVERYGPQPVGRVIHLLVQACRSLAEAHAAGLVHRDVKPANLFACRAADEVDVVKVLDFGLVQTGRQHLDADTMTSLGDRVTTIRGKGARAESASASGATSTPDLAPGADSRLTRAGQYMGTPAFMAPEQILGQDVDGRADLYALGCVAVWLLTGEPLFEAPTAMAIMVEHMTKPVPDLRSKIVGYYPDALDVVLRRCLEKARDDRYADARAFAEALSAVDVPEEERWNDRRARAWWDEVLDRAPASTADISERITREQRA
jgi:eukaryotic-like serine/threonine-protein kinase